MPVSAPTSTVTINGTQRGCTQASARFSFTTNPATATFIVPGSTWGLNHDESVSWVLDGVTRFTGLVRDYERDIEGMTTVHANSPDTRLAEYQNSQDPFFWGGLTISDMTGSSTATGGQLINAVLGIVGVSIGGGTIGDNGVVLNTSGIEQPFVWGAGTVPSPTGESISDFQGAGESALDYINKICRIMAVRDVGFYRFFSTTGGDLYVHLIGGRPRSSPDFTFTEGVDFISGIATRRYPQANTVVVTGFNFGDGGPYQDGGPESFRMPNSNPFMPGSSPFTYTYSSPLIELSNDTDFNGVGPSGMSCETVASAIMPDVNRQTVYIRGSVYSSALLGPGQTIRVQGNAGGGTGNMGVGEDLWLQDLTVRFDSDGITQEVICIGGGSPDNTSGTPPV